MANKLIRWFDCLSMQDIELVGGKNASLGEMISCLTRLGVQVPQGFAVTTEAYSLFLQHNQLDDKITSLLNTLDSTQLPQLTEVGEKIRQWIKAAVIPIELQQAISDAYAKLQIPPTPLFQRGVGGINLSVAVRSSATAEDLPDASFAGQQETYLNVVGIDNILRAVKDVFASLFNDRAISYRAHHQIKHEHTRISVGIQQMVRSDLGASGVLFTVDTESGFDQVVFVTAAYGLGELVVQGAVNPDEFYVFKPALQAGKKAVICKTLGSKQQKMIYSSEQGATIMTVPTSLAEQTTFALSEQELETLAKQALLIEQHYGRPMDIEWAKDGINQQLYIVQARPETVTTRQGNQLERYQLMGKGEVLIEGRSVGNRVGQGIARVVKHARDMSQVQSGDVLVTDMTDPDWEPVMKRASAIVTNRGGRTCHAAIIARELGIPAVVGCGSATEVIADKQSVTVSCAEGDTGYVYAGLVPYECNKITVDTLANLPVKIMMTVANPENVFALQSLPNAGVGLARLEFIIAQTIGIHPKACLNLKNLSSDLQQAILQRTVGYPSPTAFYVDKMAEGIATIAAAFWPKPVIVRMSDFKSNEYANLLGGHGFEPEEENPMLGFRGAGRYAASEFGDCFALECQAVHKVRNAMGLTNVEVMIPFVRTPEEARSVVDLLAAADLKRGEHGLRIIMMCEIPTNALRADEFLQHFDGFSIGSNDLTQLTLGIDRDSGIVAKQFDERDPAVKMLLEMAIVACKKHGKSIGICGQGPSDHPDLARWLLEKGIDSMSLNPDSVLATWMYLATIPVVGAGLVLALPSQL